jgi:hypothetical protein
MKENGIDVHVTRIGETESTHKIMLGKLAEISYLRELGLDSMVILT